MAKYDYLNNYLNSNMNTKFKKGGMLTQYNVGGTHEQNPNGGIPLGPDATVEQGETSMNVDQQGTPINRESPSKYIFSEDSGFNVSNQELKARGLPSTRKDGESFASYSKRLTKPFEGREGDKAAAETKKEFLSRLAAYHEEKKAAQAAQIQQAMSMNASQNQISQEPAPEDYSEEFQQAPTPMYIGGSFGRTEAGNLTGGASGISSTMPNARVNFYTGGLMRRRYDTGGYNYADKLMETDPDSTQGATTTSDTTAAASGLASSIGGTTGSVGTAATGVMDLYSIGKGNTSTNMGKAVGQGALAGATTGAAVGSIIPGVGTVIGGAVGAVVGAGAGYFGGKAARKKEIKATAKAGEQANSGMPNADAWTGMGRTGGYITRQPANYKCGGMIMNYNTGGIYIKPENRGKFTASAKAAGHGVQEHARMVVNDPNASPLQKKRAQFALNAAKWHQDGGYTGPGDGVITDEEMTQRLSQAYKYGTPTNAVFGTGTNPAHNVQTELGLKPGKWGPKSKSALLDYQNDRLLNYDGAYGPEVFNAMGLTPGGRQYTPTVDVNTAPGYFGNKTQGKLLPQPAAKVNTVTPEDKKQLSALISKEDLAKAGDKMGQYGRELGRAYPILSNFFQREQLSKPKGTMYSQLSNAFDIPQVDEARRLREFNSMQANKYRAISQMGGSQAQQRAMMLGVGAQGIGDLGKIYEADEAARREQALQKIQYQNQIAQYNAGAIDRSKEAYDRDLGNYETQRSKLTGQIGTDIGAMAKEQTHMAQVAAMYGYDWNGKYMINRKTGKPATPEEISKIKGVAATTPPADATQPIAPSTAVQRMGGYITRRKY